MKKLTIILLIITIISVVGCSKEPENNGKEDITGILLENQNYFEQQAIIDDNILKESKNDYSLDNPLVIVNPYGNSPLSAVAIFSTNKKTSVTITVKGKSAEDDVKGTTKSAKRHIVPIYGLYADSINKVELTLNDGTTNTIEITTGEVASSIDAAAVMYDGSAYDYSDFIFTGSNELSAIVAFDSKGDMRLHLDNLVFFSAKRLANGHLMAAIDSILEPEYYRSALVEVDLMGRIYNYYIVPGGQHHDFFEMKKGNLLVVSNRTDFTSFEDYIIEIDRKKGKVVYELDLMSILDPSDGGSINRESPDNWLKINGIWYDEETDNILLSGRNVDGIVAVNKTNKTLKWILGDPDGWKKVDSTYFFTPVSIGSHFEWQYAQNQVSILPDGNILLFDNGAGRTKTTKTNQLATGDNVYSRAASYKIDTVNMIVGQAWEYGRERGPSWYSSFNGGAICLNDDPNNIWITSGGNIYIEETDSYDEDYTSVNLPEAQISSYLSQVKDNKLIFELKLNTLCYRSLKIPMYTKDNNFEPSKEGKYLGNLGKSYTTDIYVDFENVQEGDGSWMLNQTPERLTFTGTYKVAGLESVKDTYLVLKTKETVTSYKLLQSTEETEDGIIVTMTGWISPVGLEGSYFDIYIFKEGVTCNTGYSVGF